MKTVSRTTQFKRDFKRMVKRGKGPAELRSVVEMLCRVAGMNYFKVEFGTRKGNSSGYKSR